MMFLLYDFFNNILGTEKGREISRPFIVSLLYRHQANSAGVGRVFLVLLLTQKASFFLCSHRNDFSTNAHVEL